MMRMGGADAFMLLAETPRSYMHTFKVAIIDPSSDPEGWDFERFHTDLEERLHLIPYFRWKYAPSPLGINHPMWVDDPDFNLDYHVRRVACPAPGDHRALCEFMSSVYAYQLDRSRPLWMSWVVEGLQDGRVALVTLVHHAYVDGVGASYGLQRMFRPDPGFRPDQVAPWEPRPWPSWGKRLLWGLKDMPRTLFTHLPKVVSGVRQKIAMDRRTRRQGLPAHPSGKMMPHTPINRNLTPGRTFVCNSMPLAKFKRVSKHLGYTINDVFLACGAGALRRLLRDMDYDPDQGPLIAGTPFAGERPPDMPGLGNYVTLDHCWLPTHIDDPMGRLQAAHEAATEMKAHLKASVEAGADFNSLMQILPPFMVKAIRWYIESKQGAFSLFGNVAMSNVPGPREPLYLEHYKLANWFSTGQVFDGTCLNLTMWSYCDHANLCVLGDKAVLPDGWVLYEAFVEELDQLDSLVAAQIDTEGGRRMSKLAPLDLAFLLLENPARQMHMAAYQVFRLPGRQKTTFVPRLLDAFRTGEVGRPFNQKLNWLEGGMASWETVTPDLDYHVRHVAVPAPGRIEDFYRLVSFLNSPLLDRGRPLWECYVIEGLADNRFAVLIKVHHALIDGMGALKLFDQSLSRDPADKSLRPVWMPMDQGPKKRSPRAGKSQLEKLSGRLGSLPGNLFEMGTSLIDLGAQNLGLKTAQASPLFGAAETPFNNTPTSSERRYANCELAVERVRRVASATDTTVNDVIMTLIDHALHSYLGEHHAPAGKPLVALMPMSVRAQGGEASGNQVSAELVAMGEPASPPRQRLDEVHRATSSAKGRSSKMPTAARQLYTLFIAGSSALPDIASAMKSIPSGNLVISNMVGPRDQLYLAGAPLVAFHGLPIVPPGGGLNITFATVHDTICLGIGAAPEAVDDPYHLTRLIGETLEQLETSIGDDKPASKRRGAAPKKSRRRRSRN